MFDVRNLERDDARKKLKGEVEKLKAGEDMVVLSDEELDCCEEARSDEYFVQSSVCRCGSVVTKLEG